MAYERYIKDMKEDMETMTEQSQMTKDQILEITWRKLAALDVPFINQARDDYEKEKDKIIKEQVELDKKSVELVDKYYDSIMKLVNTDEPKE